MFISNQIGP